MSLTFWKLDGSLQLVDSQVQSEGEAAAEVEGLGITVIRAYKGVAPVIVCEGSGCPTGAANFVEVEDNLSRHDFFLLGQKGYHEYDQIALASAKLLFDRPVPIPWGKPEIIDLGIGSAGGSVTFEPMEIKSRMLGGAGRRYLGTGTYRAYNIVGVVHVVAVGIAPHIQTKVSLTQLPIRIFPPMFALYFTDPEVVSPAIKPFEAEASFATDVLVEFVTVLDARGQHAVRVENF